MTSVWDPGPPEQTDIPEDDLRRGLSEALVRLGMEGHSTTERAHPSDGSRAAVALQEELAWVVPGINPTPIREALQNVHLATSSGHDHVWTLGLALTSRRVLGTSLSTVIRGALEAYARSHFLMGDMSPRGVLVRHLASRRSVLDEAVKKRKGRAPEQIEASSRMMERVRQLAAAWEISWQEIDPTGYRAAVNGVLDSYAAGSGHDIPENIYGMLSETAHSETVGFRHFMKSREELDPFGRETATAGLNYDFINAQVQILVGVHEDVTARYLDFCGVPSEQRAHWLEEVRYSKEMVKYVHDEMAAP
jgi:hypothetical protein